MGAEGVKSAGEGCELWEVNCSYSTCSNDGMTGRMIAFKLRLVWATLTGEDMATMSVWNCFEIRLCTSREVNMRLNLPKY